MSSQTDTNSSAKRPLYHTENRAGYIGGVLQQNPSMLTPEMLAQNLRAGLFIEKGVAIRNTIEAGLIRSAVREVENIEAIHSKQCEKSCVKKIHIIQTNPSSNLSQSKLPAGKNVDDSTIITNYQYPLVTRVFSSLFAENPIPHLTVFTPNSLASEQSNNQANDPSIKQTIDPSTGSSVIEHEPRVIGTELWDIDRCSVHQSYIVQYVNDGDAFYASVYPTNFSGAVDYLRIKARRWLGLRDT